MLAITVLLGTKYACNLSKNKDYMSRLHEYLVHNETVIAGISDPNRD